MLKLTAVEFHKHVKFPTGPDGHGRNYERYQTDHPQTPDRQFTITWDPDAQEVVVQHVMTGLTVGVPRANLAHTRPAIGAVARQLEAAWAKANNPVTAAESPQAKAGGR